MTPAESAERSALADAIERKRQELEWERERPERNKMEGWQLAELLRDIWSYEQTLASFDAAHKGEG